MTRRGKSILLRLVSFALFFAMAFGGAGLCVSYAGLPSEEAGGVVPTTLPAGVKIIWDDYGNQYHTRPNTVTVDILRFGDQNFRFKLYEPSPGALPPLEEDPAIALLPVTLDEDGNWYHALGLSTIDSVPLADAGYTASIEDISLYKTTIRQAQIPGILVGAPDQETVFGFEIVCRYRRPSTPSPKPEIMPEGSFSLSAVKELTGMDLAADMFSFELYEGETLLQTKTNAADGAIAFDDIKYVKSDAGTHTYTMKEVAGDLDGVTYDDSVYTITVTVENDGSSALKVSAEGADGIVFRNSYEAGIGGPSDPEEGDDPDKPAVTEDSEETTDPANALSPYSNADSANERAVEKSPNTGDNRNTAIWISISALALLGIVLLSRKREEEQE